MATASNAELVERARSLACPNRLSKDCVSAEVGCALVTSKNNLFVGVSIDADCGIGTCAEHGAMQNMLASGESRIRTIVAVAADGTILPPCGRCRELIYLNQWKESGHQHYRWKTQDSKIEGPTA